MQNPTTKLANLKILIIEDNPGDVLLIEEYLAEKVELPNIVVASNFGEANAQIKGQKPFDVVFLDLSLPDLSGKELITKVMDMAYGTPVIVLTGYADHSFGVESVALGASDYLLKDELTPNVLYKSIAYNLERKKSSRALVESEKRYNDLFHLSPLPMWVYDVETLCFLDVNNAAIEHYGYSRMDFLGMTLRDIRDEKGLEELEGALKLPRLPNKTMQYKGVLRHKKKNGDLIFVDVRANEITFQGRKAEVVLCNDITERLQYIEAIEAQNAKLREIAWIQSHVVRAPLARMMALINAMDIIEDSEMTQEELFRHIMNSAYELDKIIRDITSKTDQIDLSLK